MKESNKEVHGNLYNDSLPDRWGQTERRINMKYNAVSATTQTRIKISSDSGGVNLTRQLFGYA